MPLRCCIKVFSVLARIRINCDLHYLSILGQGASALPHLCDLRPPLLPIGPYQIVMQLDTFLQAISRLGLTRWDGIEEDIAWGHVTSLMGLARPSIEGPLFIYRAPIQLGGPPLVYKSGLISTRVRSPSYQLLQLALKILVTQCRLSHGA